MARKTPPLSTEEEQLKVEILGQHQPLPVAVVGVPFVSGTTSMDLQRVPTGDLRIELARGLTMTAEGLARMGVIWQELERRGEDLSDLRQGIALYLPLIAAGQLAAEAVVAFASRRSVLRALEGVPLDEQRRLAAGGLLAVIDPTEPERVEQVTLGTLPSAALPLVFDAGTVRPPALQRIALRARRPRRHTEASPERVYQPRYDPATGALTVGRMTLRLADLLAVLSAAAGPDRPMDVAEEYVSVKTRMSKEEAERFASLCRRLELPDWQVIRMAIRAFGLLAGGQP